MGCLTIFYLVPQIEVVVFSHHLWPAPYIKFSLKPLVFSLFLTGPIYILCQNSFSSLSLLVTSASFFSFAPNRLFCFAIHVPLNDHWQWFPSSQVLWSSRQWDHSYKPLAQLNRLGFTLHSGTIFISWGSCKKLLYFVTCNNIDLFPHHSGGQESEIKVSTEVYSLQSFQGRVLPSSSGFWWF